MPYVPSLKTDGKSQDRVLLDAKVEVLAKRIAEDAVSNLDVLRLYFLAFRDIGSKLVEWQRSGLTTTTEATASTPAIELAQEIWNVGAKYKYEGAFLGELNYSITRLIQRVPQIKVSLGQWEEKSEIRYWLYAITTEALTTVADLFKSDFVGIAGVFEDIKDEYKWRVNRSYEAAQIVKSGDCFDAPYYTRLVEVLDDKGNHIGYQEVLLKRSPATLNVDVLEAQVVLRTPVTSDKGE